MINHVKYMAVAGALLLSAAPAVWAHSAAANAGPRTGQRAEQQGNNGNAGYLTKRMEQYSQRHNGRAGLVGNRGGEQQPNAGKAQASGNWGPNAQANRNIGQPGYLTQRLRRYGAANNQQQTQKNRQQAANARNNAAAQPQQTGSSSQPRQAGSNGAGK